jgi:hypothetical protein
MAFRGAHRWLPFCMTLGLLVACVAAPGVADARESARDRSTDGPPADLINITLSAVTAISSDDVWAVGGGADPNDPDNSDPAVEHWDGAAWVQVPAEATAENEEGLVGVSAVGPNDIWAVGSSGQPSFRDKQIEIEHWDGTAWRFSLPVQASFNNVLSGVAAVSANDVWAVGALSTGGTGRNRALIEHWNGTTWSVAAIPDPAGTDSLSKVTAVSASDVWAVGSGGPANGGPSRPLFMHWNGSTWSLVRSPTVQGKTTVLADVTSVASNDVWAVGSFFDFSVPSFSSTLTEHWDGQRWRIVKSADTGKDNADGLAAAAGIGHDDVWAIGNFVQHGEQTLTEHWNGSSWTIAAAPRSFLMSGATAVATDDVWAVGSSLRIFDSEIVHWDGSSWRVVPSP